ncbi:YdcF family protein [Candidatus Saccharibacteria bacterium]|nr:YdcF family protein [Candidatus Saccharibacteria bacterium]
MKVSMMRFVKLIIIGVLLAFTLFVAANAWSIYKYSKVDETRETDVAIILGAALTKDGVSPVFRERINHGIWLYNNKYVKKLIITGGYGEGSYKSDAYIGKKYAESQKIPSRDILIEESSTATEENLKNAKTIMDDNRLNTALIVSDPLHMKRAILLANEAGITCYTSPTKTTAYKGREIKLKFLLREVFTYTEYKIKALFQ